MNLHSCLVMLLCFVDLCGSLVCWHCIADNCDANPEDNQRAEQRHCLEGQVCQKVVFGMQSDIDDTKYKSTVRSCSEECIPQNDYLNCSNDLYITRGCVKRACCSDGDLCNGATSIRGKPSHPYQFIFLTLWQTLIVFGAFVLMK